LSGQIGLINWKSKAAQRAKATHSRKAIIKPHPNAPLSATGDACVKEEE
jgi:hypothetical protein